MKLAFIILAHKEPNQLAKLVERLNHPDSLFFVHIDKKSSIEEFKTSLSGIGNIFWVDREDGRWGDWGIVKATINALKSIVEHPELYQISHCILLSGQDYPLKNIEAIHNFFAENRGRSFVEHSPLPLSQLNFAGMDRIECYSYNLRNRRHTAIPLSWKPQFNLKGHLLNLFLLLLSFSKGKRKHPKNIKPYYGSQWWVIDADSCKKVVVFLQDNPSFLKYHYYTILPDELFFQTILLHLKEHNSERIEINNHNLHFIDWSEGASHPKTLVVEDYPKIINSKQLFARKFDALMSKELTNKLDETT